MSPRRKKGAVPSAEVRAEVMTVRELARYLECHPGTIYRFLKLGEIPAFRLGGGWRFRRHAIDEWITELTRAGPPKRQNDNDRAGPRKRSKKRPNPGVKASA